MIVIDASVVVEWVLDRHDVSRHVEDSTDDSVHCPELVDVEALSAFRRYERSGEFSPEELTRAVDLLRVAPIVRYSHKDLTPLVWRLRDNSTAYDASYLALAAAIDARQLWTFDRGQAEAGGRLLGDRRVRLLGRTDT